MKTVRAKEVTIPALGMFIKRAMTITCGSCLGTFKDTPVVCTNMVSKCPFCHAINNLPVTEN